MLVSISPILYDVCCLVLLVQAFHLMAGQSGADRGRQQSWKRDRTGLRIIHPELLNANGDLTDEPLLVVHFPDQDTSEPTAA
jgi:hypothetical protein